MSQVSSKKINNVPDRVLKKYVKRARMWVTTTIKDGKQSQEWGSK